MIEDVSSLPAADVNLSDLSSATLNLMDNTVLTGTATAVSSIGHYGSDVTVSVITDFSSTVPRLGPSQPRISRSKARPYTSTLDVQCSQASAEQPRSLRSGGPRYWDEEALKKGNHPGLRDLPWLPDVFEK